MNQVAYVLLGLVGGIFGGMFGLGGGLIIIPALVYLFGLTQQQAQGTSLFIMLPPIGLLAALKYYHSGNVKMGIVGFVCAGFLIGGLLGAHLVQNMSGVVLRRLFGFVMLIVSARMILGK